MSQSWLLLSTTALLSFAHFSFAQLNNISCEAGRIGEVYFNERDGKCIISIGGSCELTHDDPYRQTYQCGLERGTARCAKSSYVFETCQCEPGFYPLRDDQFSCGRPSFSLGYMERCEEHNQFCKGGLTCRNGNCQCQYNYLWNANTSSCHEDPCRGSRNVIYSWELQKCIIKVGATCYSSQAGFQCGANAECTRRGMCLCQEGYVREAGNEFSCVIPILHGFGEACDEFQNACDHQYSCGANGICVCRSSSIWNNRKSMCYSDDYCQRETGYGAFYDRNSETCRCRIQLDCNTTYDNSYCPDNAHLETTYFNGVEEVQRRNPLCYCNPGFFYANDGLLCGRTKSYGDSCINQEVDPCVRESVGAIQCIDGVCTCDNSTSVWDPADKRCKLKGGQNCSRRTHLGGEISLVDPCTRNSQCVLNENSSNRGVCECSADHPLTEFGTCIGHYNSTCFDANDCEEGLDCVDGFCDCRGALGQIFDQEGSRCLSLVGTTCTRKNSSSEATCVANSQCNSTTSTCTCNEGFTGSTNLVRCYKALDYGDKCSSSDCDLTKGLACINGQCSCIDDFSLQYDLAQQKCVATNGNFCGLHEVKHSCIASTGTCEYYSISCELDSECRQESEASRKSDVGKICVPRYRAPLPSEDIVL